MSNAIVPASESLNIAASAVGASLVQVERASDTLVRETAGLSVSLIEASSLPDLHFADCQPALADVAEAQQLAVRARFHMVRAHARMATLARSKGIDWTMWGDVLPTPPSIEGQPELSSQLREEA